MHVNFVKIEYPNQDKTVFGNVKDIACVWVDQAMQAYIFAGKSDIEGEPIVWTGLMPDEATGTRQDVVDALGEVSWHVASEETVRSWKE